MTQAEKLSVLKTMLGITDTSQDAVLSVYLSFAKQEILAHLYSLIPQPDDVTDVPVRYESVQVAACMAGFNLRGAENQTSHTENGTSRSFKYADMVLYIQSNVIPYARVGANYAGA